MLRNYFLIIAIIRKAVNPSGNWRTAAYVLSILSPSTTHVLTQVLALTVYYLH